MKNEALKYFFINLGFTEYLNIRKSDNTLLCINYEMRLNNKHHIISFWDNHIFYNSSKEHWNIDLEGNHEKFLNYIKNIPDIKNLIRKHKISLLNG